MFSSAISASVSVPKMPQSAWAYEVPSFVVDDSPLIWGQDCLNVMQDMMCGWAQSEQTVNTYLFLCACSLPVFSFISITLDAYNRGMVTGSGDPPWKTSVI